jgi:chaperone BCS1
LGIPNKLCLLLHGEPGTGKTTTIITTASYFGRDIFYVSLKNISNNDLKMIFDYVNEKHSNQGIIVLNNLDSGLTLDFFLNVLDGTLTSNNSIVIMTTNHLDKINPVIYRAGRVDSLIEMKKSDHTQIKKMFKRFISRDIDDKILSQIEEFKYEPAKIIFRLKEFIKNTDTTDEEIMCPFITQFTNNI